MKYKNNGILWARYFIYERNNVKIFFQLKKTHKTNIDEN